MKASLCAAGTDSSNHNALEDGIARHDDLVVPGLDAASHVLRKSQSAEGKTRVKVVVKRVIAKDIGSAVVLRGQTAAARQVDVQAETTAVVISEPLRKGSRVEEGQEMCVLDVGTRGAALEETRARLSEAESRVPEAAFLSVRHP